MHLHPVQALPRPLVYEGKKCWDETGAKETGKEGEEERENKENSGCGLGKGLPDIPLV